MSGAFGSHYRWKIFLSNSNPIMTFEVGRCGGIIMYVMGLIGSCAISPGPRTERRIEGTLLFASFGRELVLAYKATYFSLYFDV